MSCCPDDCTTLKPNTSQAVTLSEVVDVDDAYVNDGVCTYDLLLKEDWSSLGTGSMPYVTNSNGNYRGTITAAQTATVTKGTIYVVRIVITSGAFQLQEDLEVIGG